MAENIGTTENEKEVRYTFRSPEELLALTQRLNRVEGQIRGIKRMLESNAYCTDVLIQVSAATAAMRSFGGALLSNHLRSVVANELREGNVESIDELVSAFQKMIK